MIDNSSSRERKAILLEEAIAALRTYKATLPLAKARGTTGAKADALIVKLERLADRVASR